MGLVESEENMQPGSRFLEVEGVQIQWDEYVEQLMQMYGRLMVDYLKGFWGEKFYLGFEGVRC